MHLQGFSDAEGWMPTTFRLLMTGCGGYYIVRRMVWTVSNLEQVEFVDCT